jgi:hypothetical protein
MISAVFSRVEAGPEGSGRRLGKLPLTRYLTAMSTVQEIEAEIPRLSRAEPEELRAWFDDYVEDQLELTDEKRADLSQSGPHVAVLI